MRILIISALYPPSVVGGAEKAAALLAEAMVNEGHHAVVISLHSGKNETTEQRNGVSVYRVPLDNIYWTFGRKQKPNAAARLLWHLVDLWNFKSARRVGRILDEERPDVVHTHVISGFSVAVWKEARKRGIKVVHTMHDYYMLCDRSCMFRAGSVCKTRCADCTALTAPRKLASTMVDGLISVSSHVLQTHQKEGFFKGVLASVIHNVMDFAPETESSSKPAAGAGLVFGFIGKLEEEKGIRVLLEATRQLTSPNWRLRIAGKGGEAYVAALKAEFTDPRIEWLGFTNSREFYRSVDVSIVPSVWGDPLPYVVVEAIVAGKSLIYAQSGGIPELAKLAKTARMVPPGDSHGLARAMEEAIAQPQQWREGGLLDPQSAALFSEKTVVERHLAHYRNAGVQSQPVSALLSPESV